MRYRPLLFQLQRNEFSFNDSRATSACLTLSRMYPCQYFYVPIGIISAKFSIQPEAIGKMFYSQNSARKRNSCFSACLACLLLDYVDPQLMLRHFFCRSISSVAHRSNQFDDILTFKTFDGLQID